MALIDGEITDKQFEPARFTEPAIVKFLENVKVKRNDELSALYAEAVANIVHIELKDGRTLTKRVDYPLGNAKNRLKDTELEGKVTALIAPALGEDKVKKILAHAWKLDEAPNVTELMRLVEMPA